jgi:multiple sugar transport system permease protein
MDFLETRRPAPGHDVYLPLACVRVRAAVPVLLDGRSRRSSPNDELLSRDGNPFWVMAPTLAHFKKLLFDTAYPWLWNTMLVSVVATFLSLAASGAGGLCDRAAALQGAKQTGLAIFLAYLVPPSILFIPLADVVFKLGLFDTRLALILTYPTFLIPFCTWLLMGYFRSIPYELEECALIDGATPLADPDQDHPAAGGAGADQRRHLRLHAELERVHLRADLRVLVRDQDRAGGRVTELVEGDVYHWGPLMAGALLGSLPVAIFYSFFVEYYVSG